MLPHRQGAREIQRGAGRRLPPSCANPKLPYGNSGPFALPLKSRPREPEDPYDDFVGGSVRPTPRILALALVTLAFACGKEPASESKRSGSDASADAIALPQPAPSPQVASKKPAPKPAPQQAPVAPPEPPTAPPPAPPPASPVVEAPLPVSKLAWDGITLQGDARAALIPID